MGGKELTKRTKRPGKADETMKLPRQGNDQTGNADFPREKRLHVVPRGSFIEFLQSERFTERVDSRGKKDGSFIDGLLEQAFQTVYDETPHE